MSHNKRDYLSEDGELSKSPLESKQKSKRSSLRNADEDDIFDALDIRPPQAKTSRSKRKDYEEKDTKRSSDKYRSRGKRHREHKGRDHHKERHRHSDHHMNDEKGKLEHDDNEKARVYKALQDFHKHLLDKKNNEYESEPNREMVEKHKHAEDKTEQQREERKLKKDKKTKTKHKLSEEEIAHRKLATIEKIIRAEHLISRIKEKSKILERQGKLDSESEEGTSQTNDNSSIPLYKDSNENMDDSSDESVHHHHVLPETSPNRSDNELETDSPIEQNMNYVESSDEETSKLDDTLPPYYPAIEGCRSIKEFQILNRIEEGTYGIVYRARDKRTEEIVALKQLKMEREKEGFPITSLREINTLLKGQHPNIVTVREILVGNHMDNIFITMDYVEHDLKSLMQTMRHKKYSFMAGEIKCLLKQLLTAVAHLHDNWILHRDLKTSNLLLSHKGILKVGDFGLAREYGSPLKAYTPIVVTLWYRAPELLLCTKEYSTPIDIWSVGCIFAEFLLMNALFPGKSEVEQINRIFKDLGTPNEEVWPGFNKLPAVKKMKFAEYPGVNLRSKFSNVSEIGLGLLTKFLTFDPSQRITAEEALTHAYFTEPPLPIDPSMFPTWPAKSELGTKRALAASPKPPSGGGEYKKLNGIDAEGFGFHLASEDSNQQRGGGFNLRF